MANKYYPTKKFIKSKSIWAVYKGEECIIIGNFDDIEKKMNWKRATTFYYVSKSYKNRLSKMKYKNTNIYVVLIEKVKGKPMNYRENYIKRKWESESRKSK